MNRRSFTITELMVICVILLIIFGFMTPVVRKAREAGRRVDCANNLRQIGLAVHLYCDDNDGVFPGFSSEKWFEELASYLEVTGDPFYADIYECPTPSDFWAQAPVGFAKAHAVALARRRRGAKGVSYNINMLLRRASFNDVENPQVKVLMYDAKDHQVDEMEEWGNDYQTSEGARFVSDRHSGGTNVLWLDTHVSWEDKEEVISTRDWWNP